MVMAWSPIPGADGYTVYQGDGIDWSSIRNSPDDDIVIFDKYWDVDVPSVTIRGLSFDLPYSIRIAAFKRENGRKIYGSRSDPLWAYWVSGGDGELEEYDVTWIVDP